MITSGGGSPAFVREIGQEWNTQYAVSKAALDMVVVKLAIALREEGFTVLGLSPGLVRTWDAIPGK